jgi:hypothetical protein
MKKRSMAARYVEVSLEDMVRFLKRNFRRKRPRRGEFRGMIYYDLALSENVAVRVWTSIPARRGMGADVGQSAMRVHLFGLKINRPLEGGKAPIVKRTQNWRTNLGKLINIAIDTYKDKEDYWEARAGAKPEEKPESQPPSRPRPGGASPKAIEYAKNLIKKVDPREWEESDLGEYGYNIPRPTLPTEDELLEMSGKDVGRLIDELKTMAVKRPPSGPPSGDAPTDKQLNQMRHFKRNPRLWSELGLDDLFDRPTVPTDEEFRTEFTKQDMSKIIGPLFKKFEEWRGQRRYSSLLEGLDLEGVDTSESRFDEPTE